MIGRALEQLQHGMAHLPGGWLSFQIAAAAAALGWLVARGEGRRRALAAAYLVGLGGAALGAAALPVLLRAPAVIAGSLDRGALLRGDLMAYGALAGLAGAYAAAARRLGLDPRAALDALSAPAGALVFFGRLGCFAAGCDFGAVTAAPWAVRYPAGSHAHLRHLAEGAVGPGAPWSLAVHPAQLYEALVGVAMAAAALAVGRRPKAPPGAAFAAAAATYAAGRLLVEAFRGDERGLVGPLSTPAWISVAALAWLSLLITARAPRASEAWRRDTPRSSGRRARSARCSGCASIPPP